MDTPTTSEAVRRGLAHPLENPTPPPVEVKFPPPPKTVILEDPNGKQVSVLAYGYRHGEDNTEPFQRVRWNHVDGNWERDPERAEWQTSNTRGGHTLVTIWPEDQEAARAARKREESLAAQVKELQRHLAIVANVTRMLAAAFDMEVEGL